MYVPVPALDDTEKRILRSLQRMGVAPGWQLMSEASVNVDELTAAVGQLTSMNLISAKGPITGSDVASTYFLMIPSNAPLADMALNSR